MGAVYFIVNLPNIKIWFNKYERWYNKQLFRSVFFLPYLLFINILFELFRIMILRVSSLISHYIPRHVFIFFFIWNCYFNINCYTLSFDAIVAHGQKDINSSRFSVTLMLMNWLYLVWKSNNHLLVYNSIDVLLEHIVLILFMHFSCICLYSVIVLIKFL